MFRIFLKGGLSKMFYNVFGNYYWKVIARARISMPKASFLGDLRQCFSST